MIYDMSLAQHEALINVRRQGGITQVAGPGKIHLWQAAKALCRKGFLREYKRSQFYITEAGRKKLTSLGSI